MGSGYSTECFGKYTLDPLFRGETGTIGTEINFPYLAHHRTTGPIYCCFRFELDKLERPF